NFTRLTIRRYRIQPKPSWANEHGTHLATTKPSHRRHHELRAVADAGGRIKRCRATNLLGYCFGDDCLAALRLQIPVGKAQNLKTAGITDDPEIKLLPFP